VRETNPLGNLFLGTLLQITANCSKLCDCGGHIWSLFACGKHRFYNKIATKL